MLQEQDRQKLDGIVKQMISNKENDANIQFVVNDFKSRYDKPAEKVGGLVSEVKQANTKRADAVALIVDSKKNVASKTLQVAGQAAGLATDVLGSGLKSAVKTVTPDKVEQGAKKLGLEILQSSLGRKALSAIGQGTAQYDKFKEAYPETAKNIEAVVNIASLIPAEVAVKIGGKGATLAGKEVVNAGEKATQSVLKSGAKIASKASDIVTPLEGGVKTVLENPKVSKITLGQKFNKYADQAAKAVEDYSVATPLELAGNEATSALKKMRATLTALGQAKQEALKTVADKVVSGVGSARAALRDELRDRVGVNLVIKDGKISVEDAVGRVSKVAFDPADNKLMVDAYSVLRNLGQNPTVRQIDDVVDALQDLLYKRKTLTAVPVNGQVEGVLKNITKGLNSSVKKVAGESYVAANDRYAQVKRIYDVLNKSLGVEGNKGASLMKQLFSPTGTAPRKLFDLVKKETGIDLVQEATLAKFAMENIGDVRQASLLEQVLKGGVPTPGSLIGRAAEKLLNTIQDPIGKAKRIIKRRPN